MRRNKFRAIKTSVDGIIFDSKKEAARYGELKLLERAGEVKNILVHERIEIIVNGIKVCSYIPDFCYLRKNNKVPLGWESIVEDVKGVRTAEYRLKKKLIKACYGINITET